MERRSWPWKKKITERLASAALEFKQSNEQLDSRFDLKDQASGMTPLQQAEAKVRFLTEQLASKNEAVLQHAKVAEEAVSGWEKAESETASVRALFDAETQKRLAAEDRVAHLDGALKECMRQLRHVREQQEEKIHEVLLKKTREWEATRSEMDAKMAKITSDLLEAEAENTAMNKLLQERAKAIKESKDARILAEEEARMLQVKLEAAEKDQNKWKYELHLLSKELQIRNEELAYNKKASEAANKQHLENVKKVAKLETECQRLRLLVRKKLPGPAAISQMRQEVEALGFVSGMPVERGRRRMSPSRRCKGDTWKADMGDSPWMMGGDMDEDQVLALSEENKTLREALLKSTSELKSAKMLCVCTSGKCSATREQLEDVSATLTYYGPYGGKPSSADGLMGSQVAESSQDPSIASVSEDALPENESSCAESWAASLIPELLHPGKDKGGSCTGQILSSACDLMDDFAEMEKLASMPAGNEALSTSMDASNEQVRSLTDTTGLQKDNSTLDCKYCLEAQSKLRTMENELVAVRSERTSARAALLSIEKQLIQTIQGSAPCSLMDALDEVRAALSEVQSTETKSPRESMNCPDKPCSEMESAEISDTRMWSPSDLSSCQSEESTSKQDASLASVKVHKAGRELILAMHKVASLADSLSQVDFDSLNLEAHNEGERDNSAGRQDDTFKHWRSSDAISCVQSLGTLCNGVIQGKVEMMDFLAEIVFALDWLVNYLFSMPSLVHESTAVRRQLGLDKPVDGPLDAEKSNSQMLSSTRTDHVHPNLHCGLKGTEQQSTGKNVDKHLMQRFSQLKADKEEGDEKLKVLTLELEALNSQLEASQLSISNLQSSLTSALDSKGSLLSEVEGLVSAKNSLESELHDARSDITRLEERARSLEVQLQDEIQCRKDLETMYQDLMGRQSCSKKEKRDINIRRDDMNLPTESTLQSKKEQEIAAAAEKLAECQQTILALGKQLKDLGVPTNGEEDSPAARHAPFKSPMSEHRSHSMSDQLPSMYGRGMDSSTTSPIGFYQPIREEDDSSLSDERSRTTSSRHGSLRGFGEGRHVSLSSSYGGYTDTTHASATCEALLSPDRPSQGAPRGKGFTSPDFQDMPSSRHTSLVPSKNLALTSPGRSPARFLSIRRKIGDTNGNKPDGLSAEKHANGFTRFFSRNKASR